MGELEERERRATVRLVNYWLSLHRGQAIPAFVDFDPHRNPIAWDQCLLASCGGEDVALEHVGNALAAIDLEIAITPSRSHRSFLNEILVPLPDALRSGTPQHVSSTRRLTGKRRLLYRSVLLPFRSLDVARHYVLGAATFKIEPAASGDTEVSEARVTEAPADIAVGADASGSRSNDPKPDTHHGEP